MIGYLILILCNILFPFIAAGYLIYFFLSPRRGLLSKFKDEFKQRFSVYNTPKPKSPVWIHASSVGEVRAIKALVANLKEDNAVIITSTTSGGREEAQKLLNADICVLLPLDFYPFMKRFINYYKPKMLLVIENELWPSMFAAAHAGKVKIGLVNARMSEKSRRTYAKIKPLLKLILGFVDFACIQSDEIAQRYKFLGLSENKITVTGNIKYDLLTENAPKLPEIKEALNKLNWQNKRLLVCGSTHPVEEDMIISTISVIAGEVNDIVYAIAPRHLERIPAVIQMLNSYKIAFVKLSGLKQKPKNGETTVLLVDAMGVLTSLYSVAAACFVGGTIAKKGGHNLLEPAIYAKPVLFGKHYYNTPETAKALLASKGAALVYEATFAQTVTDLFSVKGALEKRGKAAFECAMSFKGATKAAIKIIRENMP